MYLGPSIAVQGLAGRQPALAWALAWRRLAVPSVPPSGRLKA